MILARERKREKEKHLSERETSIGFFPHMPQPEIKHTTWGCALIWTRTAELFDAQD